jgi:hypothetical protein
VSTESQTSGKTARKGISRRTVVTGTAWAVPAIVVAGPAPHAAATPIPPITIGNTACKIPGNSGTIRNGIAFQLFINNPNNVPVTITFTQLTRDGEVAPTLFPTSVVVPANSTNYQVILEAGPYSNSANAVIVLSYSYVDPSTGQTVNASTPPTTVNILPVQGAQCPFNIP